MRIAIFGDVNERTYKRLFDAAADSKKKGASLTVLVGDAPSDRLVQRYCKENGTDVVVFKPIHIMDIKIEFKVRFFFIRNRQILHNADLVWIISDGEPADLGSDLSAVMRYCSSNGIPVMRY